MIDKIQENLKKGRYLRQLPMKSAAAYINKNGGWTDFLLAGQIIFSHRINDYTATGFPEDLHAHDYFELAICAGGEKMQYIADRQYLAFRPGTAILTKPMAVHMFRMPTPLHYDRYVLYFKPSLQIFSERSILNFLSSGNDTNAAFCFPGDDSILSCVVKAEQALLDTTSPYAEAKALLSLCELFLILSAGNAAGTDTLHSPAPAFICEIKQYIDEEFINIHSVADLTEKFFYSREYITRTFRQYYNTPLYEYILRRKLLYCGTLLREGISVEKAASLSGFRNMSSFIKVFRKFNGCTPSEYKAKNALFCEVSHKDVYLTHGSGRSKNAPTE